MGFDHAYEHGGFLYVELRRQFAEIHPSCRLDADSIIQEVELVEIHLNDLIFTVIPLELYRNHPLYRFLHGAAQNVAAFGRIKLLGELLGDG